VLELNNGDCCGGPFFVIQLTGSLAQEGDIHK
jgi:hypothetical protein